MDFAVYLQAEINFLGNLVHPSLVKLVGYCMEEDQRLLVYEFMPRGSLENHLFRSMSTTNHCTSCSFLGLWGFKSNYHIFLFHFGSGTLPLPWSVRMKIALGAAKGLAFLHEEAEKPVIYRDFKTSNILLDGVCLKANQLIKSLRFFLFSLFLYILEKSFFFRNIMQSSLILGLPKMLQTRKNPMYQPESWELMVMLPPNM